MVIIFGGTTEGRSAAEVLDEAGSTFYYSTRAEGQQLHLLHGRRLTGTLDVPGAVAFCRDHGIRLIVDAAHPFAEELHRNLIAVACRVGVPVIRYDRRYPPRTGDIVWCSDYADAVGRMEQHGVSRLLALTGVGTIGRLRPFWTAHECWFRILDRDSSRQAALRAQFPADRLVYYEHDDTAALIAQLRPDAIITKESGYSGGFTGKVETARAAGITVFAVERPPWPPRFPGVPSSSAPHPSSLVSVDGPHGLRRAVEQLLHGFFPLRSGLTTGTCATAAAVAAARRLLRGETAAAVPVVLPGGETVSVAVGYADGYAYCVKDAGDDPDVTDGLEIRATVSTAPAGDRALTGATAPAGEGSQSGEGASAIVVSGGEGVGRFTLPGFDYPPGEAAINRVPRLMLCQNLLALLPSRQPPRLTVTISVPRGAEVARRTFNPRLGIVGGISILGTTGIVMPFSEEAFIQSIGKCMEVARASGADRVIILSGGKSERFLRRHYPSLPAQAFVQYGNYIGQALTTAARLDIPRVTLGVMLGKAVKLAEGHLDTHSRQATMNRGFLQQLLDEASAGLQLPPQLTLARELWALLPAGAAARFASVVIAHCARHCQPLLPGGELTILLIDDEGQVYSSQSSTL